MSTSITARATVPGLHHWPGAPGRRAYLRDLHRHLFQVEVTVAVGHEEREVELHDLSEHVATLLAGLGSPYHPESTLVTFGARSCETLARELAAALSRYRPTVVTVSEDGENDSTWRSA